MNLRKELELKFVSNSTMNRVLKSMNMSKEKTITSKIKNSGIVEIGAHNLHKSLQK